MPPARAAPSAPAGSPRPHPDGYTLLMGNLGTHAASVGLYPKLSYDPRTDFEPIMNSASTPMLVVAKKDLPVKDFKEFIAYLKANAPKMNYGSGGIGSTSHLTCLFLESLLGVKPQHVPFRGSGPALNALLGGQVDYVCDQTVAIVPTVQAKEAKGLGRRGAEPHPGHTGRPDFGGTGTASVPGDGLECPVCAEGHAEGDRHQAECRRQGRAQG